MTFLLDTNVVSGLCKPLPHSGVLAWIQRVDDAELYLASVTIGEIQAGIQLTREHNPPKPAESNYGLMRCATHSTSAAWVALHSSAGLS